MDIKIELKTAQFNQLVDLIAKSRAIIQAHQTGEIAVPTPHNLIKIEWTAQGVEIHIPD